MLVERQSSQLARDSQQKLNQSEIDLARANDILNRTNRVQQKAQDQLLTLECKLLRLWLWFNYGSLG